MVGWLAKTIGCEGFTGSLTGGGSSANLMGLAMAREALLPANENGARPGAVYAPTRSHVDRKAVALLGIGRDHLRLIPCDDEFRIRIDLCSEAMHASQAAGMTPIAIVGSAGTVATGSIDPLTELAEIARETGRGSTSTAPMARWRRIAQPEKFAGMNQADSISLDPHKWLYQPLDCGCLLYRNPARAPAHSPIPAITPSHSRRSGGELRVLRRDHGTVAPFSCAEAVVVVALSRAGKFREAIRNDLETRSISPDSSLRHRAGAARARAA